MLKSERGFFAYAMSLAASWAWGTSLIVGMEIMQSRGLVTFIIWGTANSLAVPLFGFFAYRIPNLSRVINSKPITIFTTIVMVFCLWINMNAIFQMLERTGFLSGIPAKAVVILIMCVMAIFLFKDGLIRTIFMDFPIWGVCYALLLITLLYAIFTSNEKYEVYVYTNKNDIMWALNTCLILFSGPLMSINNWQMAEKLKSEGKMFSHYWAGLLFVVYMVFVASLSIFKFDGIMNIFFIFIVCCVALSTANSAIVGMQRILGRKIGLGIAFSSILAWLIVIPIGVMGLWLTMGNMRKYVVAACIIIALSLHLLRKSDNSGRIHDD